jgi:hypothetical protein
LGKSSSEKETVTGKIHTAGELKIDWFFDVNISAPGCARNLKLVASDLSGPQVVEVEISAYIKNIYLHDSLNKLKQSL